MAIKTGKIQTNTMVSGPLGHFTTEWDMAHIHCQELQCKCCPKTCAPVQQRGCSIAKCAAGRLKRTL